MILSRMQKEQGALKESIIVEPLNPKSALFFLAFLPQFVEPTRPVLPQFLIMEATFLGLAALNVAIWAILAGELRARFTSPSVLKTINRIGGSCLIGAGALAALARRTA